MDSKIRASHVAEAWRALEPVTRLLTAVEEGYINPSSTASWLRLDEIVEARVGLRRALAALSQLHD